MPWSTSSSTLQVTKVFQIRFWHLLSWTAISIKQKHWWILTALLLPQSLYFWWTKLSLIRVTPDEGKIRLLLLLLLQSEITKEKARALCWLAGCLCCCRISSYYLGPSSVSSCDGVVCAFVYALVLVPSTGLLVVFVNAVRIKWLPLMWWTLKLRPTCKIYEDNGRLAAVQSM